MGLEKEMSGDRYIQKIKDYKSLANVREGERDDKNV